ncbi:hypothetical protein GCM10012275_34650 [Longimycelium tulufanense]|uniref:Nitroreductase family deazaflavin-dependent oxidoreductase n=1 Tax=Longimycelium tulufanense TaxID=907463 RepID=A0A8J3CCW4_9PSEU|nr:hypothetical protein GCM10012275_34650 [Longimycelium tulufanense]
MTSSACGVKGGRARKRRVEILFGRYLANPLVRGLFRLGITPPGHALIETVGRRTGLRRVVPVVCHREGATVWLVAQHGSHAGWVRNIQASPAVRLRIRGHWYDGTAHLLPEDDVRARAATFASSTLGQRLAQAGFRALETTPMTVRIDITR